jgi:hypothetical protein
LSSVLSYNPVSVSCVNGPSSSAIRSRPTTAAEDAGAQKCCTEYAEDRPVPVAVTKDQKQTSLSECAERCDGEAREQRCQL